MTEHVEAYKLVRKMSDGSLAPLFIDKTFRFEVGEWHMAEIHPTKGYLVRPGWHCCTQPVAPHLSEEGRVWVRCHIKDFMTLQRPERQGGWWYLANRIKVLEEVLS